MDKIDFKYKPDFGERLPKAFLSWLKPVDKKLKYNQLIVDALVAEIGSNPETLSQWVYVGKQNLQYDERIAFRAKMTSDGWELLTEEKCQQAINNKQKLELQGVVTSDWLSAAISGKFRVKKCNGRVRAFYLLIPPRKRTKGYTLDTLTESGHRDCFCKTT